MPKDEWEDHLAQVPARHARLLNFMSREHHIVRYFVVRELPRIGRPIESEYIAEQLRLSHSLVLSILDDLESNLFFLTRNESGAVSWAYPVTVDETPHRLEFSTGERLFAA
jgi:hypothetical protein